MEVLLEDIELPPLTQELVDVAGELRLLFLSQRLLARLRPIVDGIGCLRLLAV